MKVGRVSIPVLLSILIIMFMAVIGCGKKEATSVISGAVNGDLVGVNGELTDVVMIKMTGGATTSTTTDASGKFIFNNQENGFYTITPYLDGYSFTPVSKDVMVNGTSVTGIDFTSSWAGYSISGTVTGPGKDGATLILYTKGTTTALATAATGSEGKYTLRHVESGKTAFSFDVTPYFTGYKFTPNTRQVDVGTASVTGIDFESSAAHDTGSAKGTYTWDSTTGKLDITWEAGTSTPCNWPKSGPPTELLVTISKTTMTWPGVMIWKRTSSTENDPAGVWTATDQSGNEYTATFTATSSTSGSISLDEKIVACSYAWPTAWSTGHYKVALIYQDPDYAVISVSVTGPGITTGLPRSLTYNGAGAWTAPDIDLLKPPTNPSDPPAPLPPPYVYTFTITDSGTTGTTWEEKSCFVLWPTDLKTEWTTPPPTQTFYWTKISDAGASYVVQLIDSNYKLIWESSKITDCSAETCSIAYNGATVLISGHTYYYYVQVRGTVACSNGISSAVESFTAH